MSSIKQFVRREIIAREREFTATVISTPKLFKFDQTANGAPVWVVDLNIGSNRVAKNVPIKASGSGARFYAQLNQTVQVRRTELGRLNVIGPGDVSIGATTTISYSLIDQSVQSTTNTDATRVFFPFESYQGQFAMTRNPGVTFDAGGSTITRDDAVDWTSDGFDDTASQTIRIGRASLLNDQGGLSVDTIAGAVMTVSGASLVDEIVASGSGLSILVEGTSLWDVASGSVNTFFPFSRLEDADGNPI